VDIPAQPKILEGATSAAVFVSYATADRKEALSVCKAIERRGAKCWISTRDVPPGENYQEAIVRSLRASRAMVLVFSDAANNSDEIKKELSLASRYHIPVMALRIEDVEPSDAFAYELSTRQWIDAFDGWDKSIDALASRLHQLPGQTAPLAAKKSHRRAKLTFSRSGLIATAAAALLVVVGAAWWFLGPAPAVAHSMMVRLSGFQRLSPDLPAMMPDAIRDEIIAAFNDQGTVGVSTASAPPPGSNPSYALGGTIRRDGDHIRVITRLSNERSGATVWSDSFDYDSSQVSRVARHTAVDAGNMVRCGLFGASTYPHSLPDAVMSDYMQYCQNAWSPAEGGKALDSARRVVASAPDFSWGWSAITVAATGQFLGQEPGLARDKVRQEGLQAAENALKLDPTNSEALAWQALLVDRTNLIGQEKLFVRGLAARPLSCGCEHDLYGAFLANVGRNAEAASERQHGVDMLALDSGSQLFLANALNVLGKRDAAKPHFNAAVDLSRDPGLADSIAVSVAPETGEYASGIKALSKSTLEMAAPKRAALIAGFRAMASGDSEAKTLAAKSLFGLSDDQWNGVVLRTLAALGANHEAAARFAKGINSRWDWPSLLWYPSMRGVLDQPEIPGTLQRLGLMKYWRATGNRPDVCSSKAPPAFCHMI